MQDKPEQPANTSPRAFPDWMRELDPILKAEDSNVLYQLFRDRRERASSRLAPRLAAYSSTDLFIAVIVLGAIFVAYLFAPWAVVIPPLLLPVVRTFLPKRRVTGRMPDHVSEVFSMQGVHQQAAIDLYLAGFTGREIFEAIYLEKRRSSCLFSFLASAAAFVLFLLLALKLAERDFWAFMLTFASGYFCWQLGISLFLRGARTARIGALERRHSLWMSPEPVTEAIAYSISSLALWVAKILLGVILVIPLLCGHAFLAEAAMYGFLPFISPAYLYSGSLVIAAVIMKMIRRADAHGIIIESLRTIELGNEAIEHLIQSEFQADARCERTHPEHIVPMSGSDNLHPRGIGGKFLGGG